MFCLCIALCPALLIVGSCGGFSFNVCCQLQALNFPVASLMALQPCKATPYLLSHPLCCVGAWTHMHAHPPNTPHPSHLALLPYTQSSQAYQVCFCCCCRANEQCTKTKEQAKLLLSDPLQREGREGAQGGEESKAWRQIHRGGSWRLVILC